MRLLHLGDLHLGKHVNEISMCQDQAYILEQILGLARAHRVDAVLLAGDVYDRNVPSEEATQLLDQFLYALSQQSVKVFVISGNHDSEVRLQYAGRLMEQAGIYIAGRYEGSVRRVCLEDEWGPVEIHMLPFVKASSVRHYHPEDETDTYDSAVRTALQYVQPASEEVGVQARRVLLAHQFVVAGGGDPALGGSEEMQQVGTIEKVGSACFDGYDYVALGHIHRPQQVGRPQVRYCGSPLKYSLSEIGHEKSVPLVTLGGKGEVQIELLPLSPLRQMRHLKGPLKQLLAHVEDPEDYIYVTLTDEAVQYEAMNRIRACYPNVMKLDYENAHTRQLREGEPGRAQHRHSFRDTVEDFFRLIDERSPSEAEWEILDQLAREAQLSAE